MRNGLFLMECRNYSTGKVYYLAKSGKLWHNSSGMIIDILYLKHTNMKRNIVLNMQRSMVTLLFSILQIILFAQDSNTTTTTTKTTTTTTWYTEPWVWVVGGAVLIIVLVALLRGGSTSNTEVSKTTVIRDDR